MESKYFKEFNSLDSEYILTDKHVHSNWTDGRESVAQIAYLAQRLGLRQIALTDHVRADSVYFDDYCIEIRSISNAQSGIKILVGLEAKIRDFDGSIDASEDMLEKAQIKIASVHSFPKDGKFYSPSEFEKKICQKLELELSLYALRRKRFNVLGHAGGMSLSVHKEFPLSFFDEIILECKKNGIAFELNSFYHATILRELVVLLKKHNCLVSLGSDAHNLLGLTRSLATFKELYN